MSTYKSRRRKAETCIKNAFLAYAGTALPIDAAQVIIGQSLTAQEATHIRIHCASSEPMPEQADLLNIKVTGSITCQASADDNDRDALETIEGLVEGFVEQPQAQMDAFLGSYAGTSCGFSDWTPVQGEDGLDEETRRYLSTYTFEVVVYHEPNP
jgi:hypothetical protein